jgi:hypothetical protein
MYFDPKGRFDLLYNNLMAFRKNWYVFSKLMIFMHEFPLSNILIPKFGQNLAKIEGFRNIPKNNVG